MDFLFGGNNAKPIGGVKPTVNNMTGKQAREAKHVGGASAFEKVTKLEMARRLRPSQLKGVGWKTTVDDVFKARKAFAAKKYSYSGQNIEKALKEGKIFAESKKMNYEQREAVLKAFMVEDVKAADDNKLSPEQLKRMSRAGRALENVGTRNIFALRGGGKKLGTDKADQIKAAKNNPLHVLEEGGEKVGHKHLGIADRQYSVSATADDQGSGHAVAAGVAGEHSASAQKLGSPVSSIGQTRAHGIGAGVGTDTTAVNLEKKPGVAPMSGAKVAPIGIPGFSNDQPFKKAA